MKNWYIYGGLVVVILLLLVAARGNSEQNRVVKTTKFDTFAQCLADAGAVFYGAFWCPHCQDQKKMFENSSKLPYVECSLPNKQMTKECVDLGITGYPTWDFADGERIDGVVQLSQLAEKTGCVLPE